MGRFNISLEFFCFLKIYSAYRYIVPGVVDSIKLVHTAAAHRVLTHIYQNTHSCTTRVHTKLLLQYTLIYYQNTH
jgi:hypothetical protein